MSKRDKKATIAAEEVSTPREVCVRTDHKGSTNGSHTCDGNVHLQQPEEDVWRVQDSSKRVTCLLSNMGSCPIPGFGTEERNVSRPTWALFWFPKSRPPRDVHRNPLVPYYRRMVHGPAALTCPRSLLEIGNSRPTNHSLHFNKIPRWFISMFTFEKG